MTTTDDALDGAPEEAKVFLSYSRKDRESAAGIAEALRSRHFGVFKDTDDILPTEEWKDRLEQLIEEADTIVFLLSPHSATSEVCAWEVEYAHSLNKRIAPILIEDTEAADIPPLLAQLNFIFCTPRDPFENAVDTLASALSTDIEWIREHTRLAGLAARWNRAGRPARLLLRGQEIADAEGWRDSRPKGAPAVTAMQAAFVSTSRQAATRRQRGWIGGSLTVTAGAVTLAVFAYFQSVEADRQRGEAERQRDAAEVARGEAVAERNAALLNESRFLAGMSARMLEEGRAAEALALAWEGLPKSEPAERPLSQEAMRALREARLNLREIALLEGQEKIASIDFAPDGSAFATSDTDGGVAVRDPATGEAISRMTGHEGGFVDVKWGANSAFLFTGGMDWTPRLWNAKTGEKLTDVLGLQTVISAVAVSSDAKRIAAGGWDGQVAMWDLSSGRMIGPLEGLEGDEDNLTELEFSPNASILAGRTYERLVLWRAEDGAVIATFGDKADHVTAMAFRPYGHELAIGRGDGHVELRDFRDGSLIADQTGQHSAPILRLAYSPDGWTIGVTDLWSAYASLLRAEVAEPVAALLGHDDALADISFSHDDRYVATGSKDGTAKIWNAETGRQIASIGGHTEGAIMARFNSKGAGIATLSGEGVARLWSGADPLSGKRFAAPDWNALAVAFDNEGGLLAVHRGSAYALSDDLVVEREIAHGMEGETAAISSDGQRFAVSDDTGRIAVFDFGTGEEVESIALAEPASVLSFADQATLLIGLRDGAVITWTRGGVPKRLAETGGAVAALRPAEDRLAVLRQEGLTILDAEGAVVSRSSEEAGAAFVGGVSPDLKRYATIEPAGRVAVRDASGNLIQRLSTEFETFRRIAFTGDGRFLFVGGGSGGAMLFDAETFAPVLRMAGEGQPLASFAIDGNRLLTGDYGGALRLVPLFIDPVSAVKEAGEIVSDLKPLSQADRCRFFLDPAEICASATGR